MSKPTNIGTGVHLIFDIFGCKNTDKLSNVEVIIEEVSEKIIKYFGLHCTSISSFRFYPEGATVLFLLTESHISIHTWPEKNYVSMDIYTCKSVDDIVEFSYSVAKKVVNDLFDSTNTIVRIVERGIDKNQSPRKPISLQTEKYTGVSLTSRALAHPTGEPHLCCSAECSSCSAEKTANNEPSRIPSPLGDWECQINGCLTTFIYI